jgi:hypothetical protein
MQDLLAGFCVTLLLVARHTKCFYHQSDRNATLRSSSLSKPQTMRLIYLCFLCLSLFLNTPAFAAETPGFVNLPQVNIIGTVKKIEVSGVCYQLVTADGTKYELLGNFPHQDGVAISAIGTLPTDIVTICQVGKPLRVDSSKLVKK